jgi:hypothetical protein
MLRISIAVAVGLGLVVVDAATAQESLRAKCDYAVVEQIGGTEAREACFAAVQAVVSAQPALGIAIAGGNPTSGSSGGGGMRFGVLPRISAGLRLNVVGVKMPDLIADQIGGEVGRFSQQYGAPAPAVGGDVSVGLTNGFSVSPGLGGIGGVSLLGSATYLPFDLLADDFEDLDLAYGIGARLHLLGESFVAPGVSLSMMRRSLQRVSFGDVCAVGIQPVSGPEIENTEYGGCAGPGDVGEFSFDLTDWSGRLVASKRMIGVGAALGLGYDRYHSELGYGFRGDEPIPGTSLAPVFRVTEEQLDSERWTVFGNLSLSLLVATLGLEGGWQQGSAPITGFDTMGSDFDPRAGVWFGSLGVRLSL